MYKWSWVIFAKKSKFHDAGGPDTVVSPSGNLCLNNCLAQYLNSYWQDFALLVGRLQIFGTMHKKMQISLKWLKYRLKILKSSFIYYFYIVPVVPKLKKLKKSPYDQNNRNWMSHWHHANYHIFCNFHWKFGTQPLKHFISIST